MLTNARIYCTGYYWDKNIIGNDFYKVNFFNTENKSAFTSRLDITPFIMKESISEITDEREKSNEFGRGCDYYRVAGDISFKISDIIPFTETIFGQTQTYRMRNFFQIKSDTSYIKYFVEIQVKEEGDYKTIFTGFVNQDAIKESIKRSNDSHIIEIKIVSLEKEFSEYYKNKHLNEYSLDMFWIQFSFGIPTLNGYYNPYYMTLQTLLKQIFNKVIENNFLFDIDPRIGGTTGGVNDLFNYSIAGISYQMTPLIVREPFFIKHTNTKTIWFPTGFQQAVDSGSNVFEWLINICDCYGWLFYIDYENISNTTYAVLKIKNRYNVADYAYYITKNNLLSSYSLEKGIPAKKFSTIALLNGSFDCGYSIHAHTKLVGERCIIFSSRKGERISADNFGKIYVGENTGYGYDLIPFAKQTLISEDDFIYDDNYEVIYIPPNYLIRDYLSLTYKRNRSEVLKIDGGRINRKWRCDFANRNNSSDDTTPVGNYDILFNGNYGGMIGFQNNHDNEIPGNNYDNRIWTYRDWIAGRTHIIGQTHQVFINNFRCLLRNPTNIESTVTLKEINIDFAKKIKFKNELGIYNESLDFAIASRKINLYKKTTELKLISI